MLPHIRYSSRFPARMVRKLILCGAGVIICISAVRKEKKKDDIMKTSRKISRVHAHAGLRSCCYRLCRRPAFIDVSPDAGTTATSRQRRNSDNGRGNRFRPDENIIYAGGKAGSRYAPAENDGKLP